MTAPHPDSFDSDDANVVTAAKGQRVHSATVAHMERLVERMYEVREGVWCMVGNGLSNQTFVEGPEGLIAIDTGESVEEMTAALNAVRNFTDAPVVAAIYTHFHYCNGTTAIAADGTDFPIWGHERIGLNLGRMAADVGPVAARGLIHQFGMMLPVEGPDGLVGGGLGRFYRNPAHGRGTPGHLPVNHAVAAPVSATIAGLRVDLSPAPSDADDNLNIFFPDLDLCINNLVWPALFNIFAIRGEEYRDPRLLLRGIDEILDFDPAYLVCAHGPPFGGREEIRAGVVDARDAIQFLWDQTVRGINRGLTLGELIADVRLPERFDRSYLTQQHYGLVEHHVRQIYAGLRGWFDGYEADLAPLPMVERTSRLIEGFGGRAKVLAGAQVALGEDDLRWALELASWLVRSEVDETGRADGGSAGEREMLASVLRAIGQRTPSANLRNWTLTRALELEGTIDLSRHRGFRASRGQILHHHPATFVHGLKTALDPELANGLDIEVAFVIDGTTTGLHLRSGVAVPTDGAGVSNRLRLTLATWAEILSGAMPLSQAIDSGEVAVEGDVSDIVNALGCFDPPTLKN